MTDIDVDIGAMRHRISVWQRARDNDGGGGGKRTDQMLGERWAAMRVASKTEVFNYSQLQQRITHVFTVRYDPIFRQGNWIELTSLHHNVEPRKFYINDVTDPNEKKEIMNLTVREGGNL